MEKLEIKATTCCLLSEYLLENTLFSAQRIEYFLKNKDVKLNGKRIKDDIRISTDDIIDIYYNDEVLYSSYCNIIFEDDNVLIVNKKPNIEVISNDFCLLRLLSQNRQELHCVHRLDRNTEGIVVFAKNRISETCLLKAFKDRTLEKYYIAYVQGIMPKKEDTLTAFIKTDTENAISAVFDKQVEGSEKIITKYKVLKNINGNSLLEVELVTGKTHQIRAHLSHIGHGVIGDGKYGEKEGFKKQALCAYKLIFHFAENSALGYLNNVVYQVKPTFLDKIKGE
jgi:23S rRNA pseudouridine955/2504/2580 synthase